MADFNTPVGNIYNFPNLPMLPEDPEVLDAQRDQRQEIEDRLNALSIYIRTLYDAFNSSGLRKTMLETMKESRDSYYQNTQETDFPWPKASNMISPLTTMGVDEVEPRLVAAVIGREPYIKAKHTGVSTREEADLITKFDNFVLEHKVKVKAVVPELIHEMLIDGTIYPLLSWNVGRKKVKRIVADPSNPQGWSRQVGEIITSGPCVELVPAEFVYHADDLNDEDWEDADVIRYVGNLTIGDIEKRAKPIEEGGYGEEGWMLPEDIDKYAASTKSEQTIQQKTEGAIDQSYVYQRNQKFIEFFEAYVKYPIDGEEDRKLVVLCEHDSFKIFRIREQVDIIDENIKPLRRMRFLKRRSLSWGYPLYTLIAGIQLGVDAMWNRCINSADITMTPWGFIKRGMSGLLQNKLQIYPGNLIEVDNPDAVNFPNLTMFQPQQFIPLILQYISFYERTLNVSDYMQGRESQIIGKKGSTATGILAILQEGKVKHEYRGGLTSIEFVDLFKNIHDLCLSHMPIEEMVKIVGSPIVHYSSTEEFIFILAGSDLVSNRFVDRQETESFTATMQPFMSLLNPITIVQDILYAYDKDPKDYINPELMQLVQHWMMVQQNTQALAQMGLPPQLARQAAEQGVTPENAEEYIKQLGKAAGEVDSQGGTGGSEGSSGAV